MSLILSGFGTTGDTTRLGRAHATSARTTRRIESIRVGFSILCAVAHSKILLSLNDGALVSGLRSPNSELASCGLNLCL